VGLRVGLDFLKKKEVFASVGIPNRDRLGHSLVVVPTTLCLLLECIGLPSNAEIKPAHEYQFCTASYPEDRAFISTALRISYPAFFT